MLKSVSQDLSTWPFLETSLPFKLGSLGWALAPYDQLPHKTGRCRDQLKYRQILRHTRADESRGQNNTSARLEMPKITRKEAEAESKAEADSPRQSSERP